MFMPIHAQRGATDVLEPLLFYVLHRASNEIADPKKLATFKMFLLDEAWLFVKNETIRSHIVQAQKTWRKHNAAMILATQSIKELQESGIPDQQYGGLNGRPRRARSTDCVPHRMSGRQAVPVDGCPP